MTPPESTPKPGKRRRCACGCYRLFTPKRKWQRFYSVKCKNDFHNYGGSFGTLKRDGVRKLISEARAAIRKEYRELLARTLDEVMASSGWTAARTKSIDYSPMALKGGIDQLAALLRELRADVVRLTGRVAKLEGGERARITEMESRLRVVEGLVRNAGTK